LKLAQSLQAKLITGCDSECGKLMRNSVQSAASTILLAHPEIGRPWRDV
jgi:hypothetical protein